jgi:hypothetical protein
VSLFEVSPVPAGLLALLVGAGATLVYATLIGRAATESDPSERATAGSVQLSALLAPVVGLRQFGRGSAACARGLARAWRDPVAASKHP